MRLHLASCALMAAFTVAGGAAQEPSTEQKPATEETPAPQPDDPGRPVLRRGGPAKKRTDSGPEKSEANIPPSIRDLPKEPGPMVPDREDRAAADAAHGKPAGDPLVEKARDSVFDFIDSLPNFVCDQITKRYANRKIEPKWKYKDRFQVELFFLEGKEDYRNIRHNGKAMKKGAPEDSGQWSTGEFGSLLAALFHPQTNARFKFRRDSTADGVPAKVYDFVVSKAESHWEIKTGYSVRPSYSGAVWLDPGSGHVLRIEMSTTSLPANYPVDKVETVVDYAWVTIGDRKYLMPARSENLTCDAGTFDCMKNEIEFRNYRKFSVESQVLAVDSDISFPDEDAEKSKKPAGKYDPPEITAKPDDKKPQN